MAEGKNAHYKSLPHRGHWFYDTCDNNTATLRYPILSEHQNIGSRAHPVGDDMGCVTARSAGWLSMKPDTVARECLWSNDQPFAGWQRPATGAATPYGRYLRSIAQF